MNDPNMPSWVDRAIIAAFVIAVVSVFVLGMVEEAINPSPHLLERVD